MKTIIVSLIDRLAQFAVKSPDTIPTNIDIFDTFFVHVGKVIEVLSLFYSSSPIAFSFGFVNSNDPTWRWQTCSHYKCHFWICHWSATPTNSTTSTKYLASVEPTSKASNLKSTNDLILFLFYLLLIFEYSKASDYAKPSAVKQTVNLLTIPLENYKNVLTVLKLTNYKKLTDYLAYDSRKKVAISIFLLHFNK